MGERILTLLKKEFIQLFRDPKMRAVVFGMPLVQVLIFGYVVKTDVDNVRMAVLDMDRSARSRELISRFEASPYFTLVAMVGSMPQLEDSMLKEEADLALYIPPDFSSQIDGNQAARLQSMVNGSISNLAGVVAAYTNIIVEKFSADVGRERLRRVALSLPAEARRNLPSLQQGIDLRVRAWYNADLESRNFYLPGVVAFMIMLLSLLLTSMAIVKEKEVGTMEQLIVTPLKPIEIVLGKTIPFALINIVVLIIITAVAVFWFKVPVRGSLPALFLGVVLFLGSSLGVGLFISTISSTMQQATMTTFFVMQPVLMLSGFAFPIEDMPLPVQYLTYLNPLRYFLVIVRGIFLRGVGLELLWPQYLALLIISFGIMTASTLRFHKRLD
jgi:ABC-2 type transport system permease protein